MKASYNWLRDYVAVDWSPATVAERLTMSGLEVEDVETIGSTLDGVVVGRVLDRQQHPNADRLSLCNVDVGLDKPLQIVCGAPNVAAGQLVPVAVVGTELNVPDRKEPGNFNTVTIRRSKIRDEYSEGMICAEDELGLTTEPREGILVLDEDTKPGIPFASYLQSRGLTTTDSVIDIAITPNRPDATSHIGIARDLAALSEKHLSVPDVAIPARGGETADRVHVQIDSAEACGRFVAMIVDGVTVAPSPAWLCQRLEAIGLRPRNNVVDVTNFVMHECGQPLHAYDLDTLNGSTIVVRNTTGPSRFVTLDDKEREVPEGTLMIRDGTRDVGIAGIMGGQNTEVSDSTTRVLIEAAFFDPSSIRKAAKKLGLQTDASYRFERGVDPNGQRYAAARAAQLISELGGGTIADGLVDERPVAPATRTIDVRLRRVDAILGVVVPPETAVRLLRAIGFTVAEAAGDVLRCAVPSFRPDVEREIDVVEELARLVGYDQIPEPEVTVIPNFVPNVRAADAVRLKAMNRIAAAGFREIVTNSILSGPDAEFANHPTVYGRAASSVVHTANAISTDMSALRPTMIASALPVVAHNLNHGQDSIRFADIGSVFGKIEEAGTLIPGYREHEALCLVAAGMWTQPSFDQPARPVDYFDVKGLVGDVCSELGLSSRFEDVAEPIAEYSEAIIVADQRIGAVGKLTALTTNRYGIDSEVFFAEIDWTTLAAFASKELRQDYSPVSKFPVVVRDIAILVDASVSARDLLDIVESDGKPLLLESGIFDVYTGKGVPDGKKSIAISMRFGADRTLQDREVDKRVAKIVESLQHAVGGELRA